jgi:transcriptional regulator with XRE-family HTH domain
MWNLPGPIIGTALVVYLSSLRIDQDSVSKEERFMRREYRFGDKTRQFRKDKGRSQEDPAAAAGLAVRTVQRAETDETKVGATLRAIAAAFNVKVKDLKTAYWVADAKPPSSSMIKSADDFRTAINRAHHIYDYEKASRR